MKPPVPELLLGVFFNYKFNFTSSDQSVQIVYFFLIQFWKVLLFLEICPFLLCCPICWHRTVCSILLWFFCISMVFVVISPLQFLILSICVLFLFFLMYLAKGLSIWFIFSENQLLVLLIFSIVFLVSILFISSRIFIIPFLLLTLGFICSSFPTSFRWKVRLFIWEFSCFWK